ncbi:Deoxynucleotidyltransferase terminal-interacting protein 2 [Amphibalanus amphitrite]|uniref:Deoxynucleotidyltransferase terminal-interacting protein 2 n=2 Tax=Amphibalanus amphitrite TaxID=1232801 RepID=A0A6A4XF70_AMPAM|nr:Deoxynucleotidyltransferase terminal-interacting protein 2 [Amphibalanus amphitrite]KAF0313221.1 Deoxynucleotidyltransferase terminal-interacting protein 2 [Amphibalanus amphitrite]
MEKKKGRLERAKTAGEGWYNMKAPELTEEVKQNLEVLQMRGAINKNRVYKKSDMRTLPKYFAMGTVVEHATDFYSSRIPKKQRKKTLVEELMADVEAKKQLKKQATKLAVKKQMKAQSQSGKKRKPFKRRKVEMD